MRRRFGALIVRSGRGPLAPLYRALYAAVVRFAAAALGRCRGVLALYLTRGCAGGDLLPGISDVDLIVVTAEESDREAVRRVGRRLARATAGLVDYYPNFVASRAGLDARWRSAPAWQYRIDEGRLRWRLLRGEDVLSRLPELSEAQRRTACWFELGRWWILFVRFLAGRELEQDPWLANVIAYKVYSELRRVADGLASGLIPRTRAEAIADDPSELAARLRSLARHRFFGEAPELLEEVAADLFARFESLWRRPVSGPWFARRGGVEQSLGRQTALAEPDLERHVAALAKGAARHWQSPLLTIRVLRSAFRREHERLVVVEAARAPAAREIAALVAAHERSWHDPRRRVEIVLRLGPLGFPLNPELPAALHRGLLVPATVPDVFLQLGEPEVPWSDYAAWYLGEWETNDQWTDATPGERRTLSRLAATARAGRIVYSPSPFPS